MKFFRWGGGEGAPAFAGDWKRAGLLFCTLPVVFLLSRLSHHGRPDAVNGFFSPKS
jgi:hypothetical protein